MSESPPLAAGLRRHDRDRYQTALFAPADRRRALFALYAFNYEVARIREAVHEPMLGLIRLQWWRDALEEIYAGARPRRHEIVEPLAAAIRAHGLSQAYFTALLDARARDMDETPPESLAALEAYASDVSGSLTLLALEILGIENPIARSAGSAIGTAYALSGLLAAAPFHAQQRRVYLPQDLIARYGLNLDRSLFALKPAPALTSVVHEIAHRSGAHLEEARRQRDAIPRAALPVFLQGVVVERRLKRLADAGYDLMHPDFAREDTLQIMRLALAAWRGRF